MVTVTFWVMVRVRTSAMVVVRVMVRVSKLLRSDRGGSSTLTTY